MRGRAPIVVKLGGSFAFSEHLRKWVEALAACVGRVVIVPGGGPFADAVRLAQTRMGFDDRAAHQMWPRTRELQPGFVAGGLGRGDSPRAHRRSGSGVDAVTHGAERRRY
jgi:Amino acid kinase family